YIMCPWYLRFLFFFASRRRHTRFSRDWSSDVCSSDLAPAVMRATCACKIVFASSELAHGDAAGQNLECGSPLSIVRQGRVGVHKIGRASCRERVWISVVVVWAEEERDMQAG